MTPKPCHEGGRGEGEEMGEWGRGEGEEMGERGRRWREGGR